MAAKREKYLLMPSISLLTDLSTVSFNNNKTATPNVVAESMSLLVPQIRRLPLPYTFFPIHNSLIILSFDGI